MAIIIKADPVINYSVRKLCPKPYRDHPKGCPNYGKRSSCPPNAPLIEDLIDLEQLTFIVVVRFNIEKHAAKMKAKHPGWTDRQCRNLLYWQPKVRRQLREDTAAFLKQHYPKLVALWIPEANGVNVTETCRKSGIILEWPPRKIVHKVALVGMGKHKPETGRQLSLEM